MNASLRQPCFGHPAGVLSFWRQLVRSQLGRQPTPFYLFSAVPIEGALKELQSAFGHLPVRHWLSCKTQPLPALLQWWRRKGLGIEVVSESEFQLALQAGFPAARILINGPAKHHWLPRQARPGLWVNFDSAAEIDLLAPLARHYDWTCGLRLQTSEEFDPENPKMPTQFGFAPEEARWALRRLLARPGLRLEIVHFHLRTNVAHAGIYERAMGEVADFCRQAGFAPRYIDLGGGFPPPYVQTRDYRPVDARFRLAAMARVYERAQENFPGLRELWLENGRWLSARSGVLVLRILDVKNRGNLRNLICDGGRTMNALISTWEQHHLFSIPARTGRTCLTTVNGPTCMAFDQLTRRPLPQSLRMGDHLVWMDAGAYHLPWETRFSHPLAPIFWHDGRRVKCVRPAELRSERGL